MLCSKFVSEGEFISIFANRKAVQVKKEFDNLIKMYSLDLDGDILRVVFATKNYGPKNMMHHLDTPVTVCEKDIIDTCADKSVEELEKIVEAFVGNHAPGCALIAINVVTENRLAKYLKGEKTYEAD